VRSTVPGMPRESGSHTFSGRTDGPERRTNVSSMVKRLGLVAGAMADRQEVVGAREQRVSATRHGRAKQRRKPEAKAEARCMALPGDDVADRLRGASPRQEGHMIDRPCGPVTVTLDACGKRDWDSCED